MNSLTKLISVIVVSIGLMVVAVYWYSKDYMPKYRWGETYNHQSDQPYGLKLLFDLLSGTRAKGGFEVVENAPRRIFEKQDTASLYMLVGYRCFIDSVDSRMLIDFVRRGNTAFISTVFSEHFIFSVLTNKEFPFFSEESYNDSLVRITINQERKDSVFNFHYKFGDRLSEYSWLGIDSAIFADSLARYGFRRLSYINHGYVDCYRIKCGKGWFIFHANPILFTNYHLSKYQGLNYINTLLSGLQKKKIYWDEYSKANKKGYSAPSKESPLRFILSERSLKWAWYLLCFFVLVFVVFNSKRKQAAIPLMPDNRNTTVEYISAIATLHYQNKSFDFLADEIMKQFLSFVKHKYGISPNLDKKEIVKLLAPRSGMNEEMLKNIFKYYLDIKFIPEVKDMLELYRLTEYFYQNCK